MDILTLKKIQVMGVLFLTKELPSFDKYINRKCSQTYKYYFIFKMFAATALRNG